MYASFPGFRSYITAIHSIETRIPAGKGITCGALLAGAFSGKNSLYTLLITLKSLPVTMKIVVFTIFERVEPASSNTALMFSKLCRTWSSKSALITWPVVLSIPGIPERNMKLFAITDCGNASLILGAREVLKFLLVFI